MTWEQVERTMEFLLERQAKADAEMVEFRTRQDRTDRQIRLLARLGQALSRRVFASLEALAKAQRAHEERLDRLDIRLTWTDERLGRLFAALERRFTGNGSGAAS